MTRTGKFATAEQIASVRSALNTPLIALQCGMPRSPQQVAHQIALDMGFPEIAGYYGMDLSTGEIVAP